MGILNFHKCIRQYYSNCIKQYWLKTYSHVYIDINYALHYCSHKTTSEEEILEKLTKFIDEILQHTMPTKSLILGSDGSAPLAKLLLQRKRRLTKSKTIDINDKSSSLIFTPGTIFMENIKNKLSDYFISIEKIYSIKIDYLNPDYDEAELKLKEKIQENIKKNKNDTHIIVSSDADVIVMLSSLEYYKNVYIFIKSKNIEIISMVKLIDSHTNKVGTSLYPGLDFMVINIFLGNDYLNKLSFINFDKIWDAYALTINIYPKGLIDNRNLTINKNFFVNFLINIIATLKNRFIKNLTYATFSKTLYDNYLDGFTWCIHTYNNGKCIRYNYMYGYQVSPHPLGLLITVINNDNLLLLNKEIYNPIDPRLYGILVLPKSSRNLINKKYHNILDNIELLYDEECCKKCNEYYFEITKINNEIKKLKDDDTIKKIKKKSIELTKEYNLHKKQHNLLTIDDILDIVEKLENKKIDN